MKKIILKAADERPKIKVQLDYRTLLIVRSMKSFQAWKARFPEAKIISQQLATGK